VSESGATAVTYGFMGVIGEGESVAGELSLRRCLERVRGRCPQSVETLLSDLDSQDIVALNLTRAVQICVDVAAHVIDEGAIPEADLTNRNLVSKLFLLERCRTPAQIREALVGLIEWLQDPAQSSLRRSHSFTIWFGRVLLPGRLRSQKIPEFQGLQEVCSDSLTSRKVEFVSSSPRMAGANTLSMRVPGA